MSGFSQIGLSGMNAASDRLNSIANNLANSSTTAYKSEDKSFSSMYVDAGRGSVGAGVKANDTSYDMNSGTIETSSGRAHMAIGGSGYFTVENASGDSLYTRAGDFEFDQYGNLVTSSGDSVMGYGPDGTTVQPISLSTDSMAPTATSSGSLNVNLGEDDQVELGASLTVTDSLGASHDLVANFSNRTYDEATGVATWDIEFTMGDEVISTSSLSFDSNGQLVTGSGDLAGTTYSLDLSGMSGANRPVGVPSLDIDFSGSTAYSGDIFVRDSDMNGNARGEFSDYEISDSGQVYSLYSNGEKVLEGTVMISTFDNENGLKPVSGNYFKSTTESGDAQNGTSGLNGAGDVYVGYLESSNVDTASELVDMIDAQQMYQANSKTITTGKEINGVLMNL